MQQGGKLAGGNPARGRAENDFYATHPDSTKALLAVEEIVYPALEPACGEGHISKLLDKEKIKSFDLIDRGFGDGVLDFLQDDFITNYNTPITYETVITNPPFNL